MANSSVQPNSVVDDKDNIFAQDAKNLWLEQGFKWLVRTFAIFVVFMFVWMIFIIFGEARPAVFKFGLGFLWSQDWDTVEGVYGALPYIYGTLVSSFLAILIAMLLALLIPIYEAWKDENIWQTMLAFASISTKTAIIALVVSVLRDDWMIGVVSVIILSVGDAGIMLLAHILKRLRET